MIWKGIAIRKGGKRQNEISGHRSASMVRFFYVKQMLRNQRKSG